MSELRVGSLTVGINDYEHESYRSDAYSLRFAEADARSFHQYLTTVWPDSPAATHRLLCNREANRAGLEAAASELASHAPFDLFFLYLAGHGDRDDAGRHWFCTAKAEPGVSDMEASALDELLLSVPSQTTLLLLDCCFAANIVRGSSFFGSLEDAHARLYVCSARGDQRTWEEDALGHGVFSHLLLKSLSSDSLASGSKSDIEVDTELFPYLCKQVPLFVYQHKGGQRQEPVKGGVSRGAIRLPLANKLAGRAELSVYEVVRSRLRQAILVTLAALLAVVLVIQVLLYHLAFGPNGRLVVRNGVRETFGLLPRSFGTRAETDFDLASFSPRDLDAVARLQNSQVWGVWTQKDSAGNREWMGRVLPFLREEIRERAALELSGELSPEFSEKARRGQEEGPGDAWESNLLADYVLLRGDNDGEKARWLAGRVPKAGDMPWDFTAPPANLLDFEKLQIPSADMVGHLEALRAYAATGQDVPFESVADTLRLVCYRAWHEEKDGKSDEVLAETKALGGLFKSFAESRRSRGREVFSPEEAATLGRFTHSWCELPTLAALARLGGMIDQGEDLERLTGLAAGTDWTAVGLKRSLLLDSAIALAAGGRLTDPLLENILAGARRKGGGIYGDDEQIDAICTIASYRPLPDTTKAMLFEQLAAASDDDDLSKLHAALILSANYKHLGGEERSRLLARVADLARANAGTTYLAHIYGYLGAGGYTDNVIIGQLNGGIRPELQDHGLDGPGRAGRPLVISSDDVEKAVALALIAVDNQLPPEVYRRLEIYAVNRSGGDERREIFKGLAAQRLRESGAGGLAGRVRSGLDGAAQDYYRRRVERAVYVEYLKMLTDADRAMILDDMRKAWREESEPTVKMDLAEIILKTIRGEGSFP